MGETADLNGHHNMPEKAEETQAGQQDAAEIRDDIEATRERMSATIDAIQDKLNPDKIKAQVGESLRAATVGKAKDLAHLVGEKAHEFSDKAREAAGPVLQNVQHTMQDKLDPDSVMASAISGGEKSGSLKPLNEQVVVVFGASSGIGRETALQFAKSGAKVVVAARGKNGLDSLVEDIQQQGGEALAVVADAADFNQVQNVAHQAAERFGGIDTWVQTAAISIYARFEDTTPEEFRRVLEVNLLGQIHGALAALPYLRQRGQGALIHVSSVESTVSLPLQSAYGASKHGMTGFLDSLRLELEDEGVPIYVTDVKPAGINTPLFNNARTKMGVKPQPAPPVYQPGVVAEVILHAAVHPTREITAGGAAQAFILSRRLSPALTDAVVRRTMVKGQQTNEPKAPDAPDNMFQPINNRGRVGGDFSAQAKGKSLGNFIETHGAARKALKVAALAAAFLIVTRAGRTR
ncbi:MAG TPA: SDR family oxidoreductase [Abditibacteriaceae bacterium]|jgi:NAD(P)-dependent dehydrogenase (short-subunit alcohol dehydrogenase family)